MIPKLQSDFGILMFPVNEAACLGMEDVLFLTVQYSK